MPPQLNLYKSGLHRLARIHKLDKKEKYSKRKKAHVTYRAATTQALFGLYTLLCFTNSFNVPYHTSNVSSTYTEKIMNRFHEVNEIYDGTMTVIHHFCFHTDITSNECFTFQQTMKQEYRMLFVEDTEIEINAHKEGSNLKIALILSVPVTVKTIKSFWSFKRKGKPDGELLKHKSQICAHGGM